MVCNRAVPDRYLPLILVSALMILLISDTGEDTRAILALVGLLSSMRAEVDHQVPLL